SGITLRTGAATDQPRIELRIDPSVHGEEAYRLIVTPQRVEIAAADDRGLFWGVQTLRQLLPPGRHATLAIPAVRIDDAPRYAWRGVMLDAARHFIPMALVKQQIDLLSRYKLNVLHWHLTDDQGWRIEIRKYPKLTSVGAWRTEADGSRSVGFYTQQDIRDVVEYARRRNVMIVPEIEMPGHASAAIAAYPSLSCPKQPIAARATRRLLLSCTTCSMRWPRCSLRRTSTSVATKCPSSNGHRALPRNSACMTSTWPMSTRCRAGSSSAFSATSKRAARPWSAGTRSSKAAPTATPWWKCGAATPRWPRRWPTATA